MKKVVAHWCGSIIQPFGIEIEQIMLPSDNTVYFIYTTGLDDILSSNTLSLKEFEESYGELPSY